MPPKRTNIGRRTRQTNQRANARQNEAEEQLSQRNQSNRLRTAASRANESEEARASRNLLAQQRSRRNRASISDANRDQQNLMERLARQSQAAINSTILYRAAYQYSNELNYSMHKYVDIGTMNKICTHCKAMKFKSEAPGICCVNGKVVLPQLNSPPEPLLSLVSGTAPQSKHFLTNIPRYNSCFHMTSFAATNIIQQNFMPTFKVTSAHTMQIKQ